jgi:thiol-disulfide isomerase/thioredoxin
VGSSKELLSKQKNLQEKRLYYKEKEKNIVYTFMKDNPKSYLNPDLLSYYIGSKLSLDSSRIMFNQFDTLVKNSLRGKILMREINGKVNSATGQIAPLFIKTDINGNEISLLSFRDKNYVLLDFWASWCVPCRKFTPTMKSYYEKYQKKGLEIVSISWDSKPEAWKEAIIKDGMEKWKNIFADMYLPQDNSMRAKFGIPSIPLLILINKKGVIIGRYMAPKEDGEQAELEKKLEEIFKKP